MEVSGVLELSTDTFSVVAANAVLRLFLLRPIAKYLVSLKYWGRPFDEITASQSCSESLLFLEFLANIALPVCATIYLDGMTHTYLLTNEGDL